MIEEIVFYSETGGFHGGVERFIYQAASALRSAGVRCRGVFAERGNEWERFSSVFHDVSFQPSELSERCRTADWLWIHKCADCRVWEPLIGKTKIALYVHDHDYYCFRRHKYFPVKRINCPLPCREWHCLPCGYASRHHPAWGMFSRNLKLTRKAGVVMAGSDFMLDILAKNSFASGSLRKLEPLIGLPGDGSGAGRKNEIVYVGQVIRGKGVDLLLNAVARVNCDWRLTVVGDGDDLESCRQLAKKLNLESKVTFAGYHMEPGEFYRRASVAVFPSRWQEPFGMTGPEAMSYGVPVVGFRVGGVSEWLHDGENGKLVESGNVEAFASALELLLKDRELASEYGKNGAMRMSGFTPSVFTGKLLEILEKASC